MENVDEEIYEILNIKLHKMIDEMFDFSSLELNDGKKYQSEVNQMYKKYAQR